MSKKTPIGKLKCVLCDFPDGEVKLDKNDKPYFYCPDCSCQILTHGGQRAKLLKAKMKPIAEAVKKAVEEMEATPAPKPKKEKPVPEAKKEKAEVPPVEKTEEKKPGFGMMGGA